MKQIAWLVPVLMALLTSAQAGVVDCTQPLGKKKKFVRCGEVMVQTDIPQSERDSLIEKYREAEILSEDLTHDGINDFVIYTTERTSTGVTNRVVILKGKPDGGSEKLAQSSTIEYGTANIEIKNGSLYVHVDHNAINESYSEIYQFKFRDGGIVMIGKEEISLFPVDENHGSESRISTNFLTGEEIKVEKTDGKITKETKEKVGRKLLRLEEFTR